MPQPLVSIIIPVYNAEKYLADCLRSAFAQTEQNIEIIAVDDGSTDGSLAILRSFAEKDSRLKILVNEKNCGRSVSRNRAIEKATGRWIAFLDNDDQFAPDFCRVLLAEAEKSGADIIKGRAKIIETDGRIRETPKQWHYDILKKSPLCFNGNWWTAIYRAEKIRGKVWLHNDAIMDEDLIFLAEAISLPLKVTCVNDIVYINIQRENSAGEYHNRSLKKIEATINSQIAILRILNEKQAYETEPFGYRIWTMEALRRLGGFHRARKDEKEIAMKICLAKAPELASLIHCDYSGLKKFLMPPLLKILKDNRLMLARTLLFRCYGLYKKFKPTKGH